MIRVLLDDLAFVPADAVLRPSDDRLQPVTPAGVRLDEMAGPVFAELRRIRDPLQRGAVVVTGGGDLVAPFVVHCVVQDAESDADRDILRRVLAAAAHQADAWGLSTVATPPIGSGIGLLDLEEAVTLLCETWQAARGPADRSLVIVVDRPGDLAIAEGVVRRLAGA